MIPSAVRSRQPFVAWRYTPQGAVKHAVWTDGTQRAVGVSICGLQPEQWMYGKSIGWQQRCLRCRETVGKDRL